MSAEQFRFYDFLRRRPPEDSNKFLIDGEFCMDDVIRTESLLDDVERICGRLGLPFEPDALPRLKAGIRDAGASLQALYTEPARRLVEARFAPEMRLFGYRDPLAA